MVRYTLAVRGPPKAFELKFEEQVVDIFNEEQLSEHFLCEVNSMGQVPVLTSPALSKPIADSLEITHWLAKLYPLLIPESYSSQINSFLERLHALNFFSLSFPGRPQVANGFKAAAEKRLAGDITERYRKALLYKIEVLKRDKIGGLQPEVTAAMSKLAQTLLIDLESVLPIPDKDSVHHKSGPWLFGLEHPTALDAHLLPFISRLRDVGRQELIPAKLGEYADLALETPEWKKLTVENLVLIPKTV
ncbi:hypothetical protein ACHAQE_001397 [Botrytis cinerea]